MLARAPAWAVVGVLVCCSTVLRAWAGSHIPTPWINADEIIYAELGRSLYGSGGFELLGQPVNFYSLVYPALIGLPLRLDDIELGYQLTKVLQALVMSLAAVPVYLWGRTLMSSHWALCAAALTVAIPGLAYSGLLMTEVAFYPVMVLAAWAMAVALARPTFTHQTLLLAAVALAVATRVQALVLLPVFCTAVVLKLLLERGGIRRLGAFVPSFAGFGLLAGGWVAWRLSRGGPASELLGAYRAAGEVSYSLEDALRSTAYHAGDLLLVTVFLPVCAVALLLVGAVRRREASARIRAYLAVTVALCFWLVVEVGVFASRHVGGLAERNLLAAAPVLFLGFGLWLDRGAPRPRLAIGIVALGTLVLILLLPVNRLVTPAAIPSAFSLVPLLSLRRSVPDANLDLILLDAAGVAMFLLALVARRFVWLLPLGVFAALAAGSVVASLEVATQAADVQRHTLGSEQPWIDRAVDAPVTFVYSGEILWTAAYENIFWNRNVRRIAVLPGFEIPGPIPQEPVGPQRNGTMVFSGPTVHRVRYATSTNYITFLGEKIAAPRKAGLVLWRVAPPFRMSTWLTGMALYSTRIDSPGGVTVSGDVYAGRARLAVYACSGGVLRLSLNSDAEETTIRIRRNGKIVHTRFLPARTRWSGSVAAPRASHDNQCEFDISSSGLLHVRELRLVRARS